MPTDDRESASLRTLAPGNYTAIVRGALDITVACESRPQMKRTLLASRGVSPRLEKSPFDATNPAKLLRCGCSRLTTLKKAHQLVQSFIRSRIYHQVIKGILMINLASGRMTSITPSDPPVQQR